MKVNAIVLWLNYQTHYSTISIVQQAAPSVSAYIVEHSRVRKLMLYGQRIPVFSIFSKSKLPPTEIRKKKCVFFSSSITSLYRPINSIIPVTLPCIVARLYFYPITDTSVEISSLPIVYPKQTLKSENHESWSDIHLGIVFLIAFTFPTFVRVRR